MKHWSDRLTALGACSEAVEWARGQKSLAAAWKECQRGDWMLWLLGKLCRSTSQRKRLVMAACACAREALVYVRKGEERPLRAIETAEKWCQGEATIEDVRNAAYAADATVAAYAAYASAASAYAASASAASASAAYAASASAASASAASAASASAAAYAASAASASASDASDARAASLARSADLVRERYPRAPRLVRS